MAVNVVAALPVFAAARILVQFEGQGSFRERRVGLRGAKGVDSALTLRQCNTEREVAQEDRPAVAEVPQTARVVGLARVANRQLETHDR